MGPAGPSLFSREFNRGSNVSVVVGVFWERAPSLGRFRGKETPPKVPARGCIATCIGDAGRERETKQMGWTLRQDCVTLGARPGDVAAHERDEAHVIAPMGVERGKCLERSHRHRRKESGTVGFALARKSHDTVEEAIGALIR
jgi:hypothetical protein